ncbi:MAG: glutamate 5-kinase [Verrucomicrobiae bacterium]|nr:glutamate 5-kinase [Verrucomicrobiae bacterium]
MDRATAISSARRVVVKIGTGVLTGAGRSLDPQRVASLADQIAALRGKSVDVAVVTSGAIGAGMAEMGLGKRPGALPELQACAAIGQSKLMSLYGEAFRRHGLHVGQILLTHADLSDRMRHLNARNTIDTLLARGVVPIINENDTVSVDEIRFGDNDRLAALVATLLPAELLIILTSADGLMSRPDGTGERISLVQRLDAHIERMAGGAGSVQSVGGMISKIQAAKIVMAAGIHMVIANGQTPGILEQVMAAQDVGTLFVANEKKMTGRKRWIAFYHRPKAFVVVDDGAKRALARGGSLLAGGVREAGGEFAAGDVIAIRDIEGVEFARGVARVGASDLPSLASRKARPEVVHRNDLVLL